MTKISKNQSDNEAVKGHFYCGHDSISKRIRFTVEASSEAEAQECMASIAPLMGITKEEKFFFVVLGKAPHGVPTFLKWFFELGAANRNEAIELQMA